MFAVALFCSLAALASPLAGPPAVSVEPMGYRDAAHAARTWRPSECAGPVSLAAGKLVLPCRMSQKGQRAYWDRDLRLNLSATSRIAFKIRVVGETSGISACTLYFRSGEGWYGGEFDAGAGDWTTVRLDRSSFVPEDTPAGWGQIDGMRIGFWKAGPVDARVELGAVAAESADTVVVRCTAPGADRSSADGMVKLLRSAGIDAGGIDDTDVAAGMLAGRRLAVYPNNPVIGEAEARGIRDFVVGGGKVAAFYALPPFLAQLLGLLNTGWTRAAYAGQFSSIQPVVSMLPGAPPYTYQASWNIQRAAPADNTTRVAATWLDGDGKPTGEAAILIGRNGSFMTHVALDDDPARKRTLLRALLGALQPSVMRDAAATAVAEAQVLGDWPDLPAARKGILSPAGSGPGAAQARKGIAAAEGLFKQASGLLKKQDYSGAIQTAEKGHAALEAAHGSAMPGKPGEFRAFWCHSAYGVQGYTWEQTCAKLAAAGFTAVLPNMLWGGVADYASEVLPVSEACKAQGDQIEACLAAARKHGLQVHVWKVNWNLGAAPEGFVTRMRTEGRLQADAQGREGAWLCPSDPRNRDLERDAMVEVARKYAVDGVHFDYIRYPDANHCFCVHCRTRFEARLGRSVAAWPADVLRDGRDREAYLEFRRSNITALVEAVAVGARAVRPGIKVSAAVFPNWPACRDEIGQDWAAWAKRGLLDFVCPMDYNGSTAQFRARVRSQRPAVAGVPLYPGIGASAPGLNASQVLRQIEAARQEKADGFTIFNLDRRTLDEIAPVLALGATRR